MKGKMKMKMYVTEENYKVSTGLFQKAPPQMTSFSGNRNSFAGFQILLHDGHKNHIVLDNNYSIPDEINTPIYRLEISSPLSVEPHFVEYYQGEGDNFYADKLLEETSHTYSGDRYAPIYVEIPLSQEVAADNYTIEIKLFKAGIVEEDILLQQKKIEIKVEEFTFAKSVSKQFNLDIWQQPSNLARQFRVIPWSSQHFKLIKEMAESLAVVGQKAITVIAGETPWKGWFNYIIKDYPANLYEYSMIKVNKTEGDEIICDFSILKRYLSCFFEAGIDQEIDVFGLLGVWQPPFFPSIEQLDYPEKVVIRYYNETQQTFNFIEEKTDLIAYICQVFRFFKEEGLWDKVRILADEPKIYEIETFKASAAELKAIAKDVQLKVVFDKEPVLRELLSDVDYPVTSYYCTCNNHQTLSESHKGKTQYYICNYPDRPNTFLHSPLLETRLQGILAYHFKTDGLLRWAYNCWPQNAKEDIRYNTTNLPIGDLCLVYPSDSGGLLLSLRYK